MKLRIQSKLGQDPWSDGHSFVSARACQARLKLLKTHSASLGDRSPIKDLDYQVVDEDEQGAVVLAETKLADWDGALTV